MTLEMQCALAPVMCRAGARPEVRSALAKAQGLTEELLDALMAHPEDAALLPAILSGGKSAISPNRDTLRRCLDEEALAFLYTCSQADACEVLQVLTHLTVAPSPAALALLLGEYRRQQAMTGYGLQLLWRILADASIPDPMGLFGREEPRRSPEDIRRSLICRLKGGCHD